MLNTPLVSVIFSFNQWNHCTETSLNSLKKQTYSKIEMIPVWCGTEEGIKEVLDYFPQGLYSAVNGSLYEGLNVGLNFATGSFVTFLLPNGIFHPLRLAKCVERLQTERGEFLFTHVCGVDHKDQLLPTDHSFWQWRQDLEFQSDLSPTIGFKMLKEMAPVSIANIIVSKRVANRVERIKTSRYGAYDFALKALFYAEPIFFKEELFDFRLSQSENNSEPDPFSYHHHPEAIAIRNDYLLQITTPPENQLAPCPAYWPMVFSSFHLACELDHGMGAKLGDVNVNPHMSKKEEIVRTLNRASLGKVTLLIHDLSLSGAPRVAADLALALKRKGYAPQVISYADGPLRPIFDQHSIPVSFVSSRIRFWYFQKKFKKVALMLSMAWKMFWKAKGTTIAIASLTWPSLFIASFCMPFRKFVWYLHDSYAPEALVLEGVPFRLFQSCIQRKNLSFWFGSDATRLIWEKAEVKGEVVYWSGIDRSQKEVQYKKSLKNILSVGAGYPRKGAHFLLDAFLTCIDKQWLSDEVCLTIVGFPETSKELTEFGSDIIRKVYASRYTHRIKLVKSIEEAKLDHLYRESDLYIQPSFLECLPLAMLKAMSLGIPVITSYVDGCNEAIIDGINGYTCPPRNSLILAEKIAYAINHPEEAQKMGVEGKKVFDEKFSLEATTPHFFSVLEKGVNEKAYTNTYSHDLNKKTAPLTELV